MWLVPPFSASTICWLHVDHEDAPACFGERDGERQADVARADDGNVVEGRLGHGAQAYRAAAMRSEAWPSPYSCGACSGNRAVSSACGELRRLGQPVRAGRHRVHPLRARAQRDAWDAEPVRLLLQSARIGDDGFGRGDEREHLEIAEWLDRLDVWGQAETVLVECVLRSRMHREDEPALQRRRAPRRSPAGDRARCSPAGGSSAPCTAARTRSSAPRQTGSNSRVASPITSPTTSRRPGTPSCSSCAAERSSGQKRRADSRSTSIRFRSSGIDRSKLRSPASTCATGTSSPGGVRSGQGRVRVAVDEHPVGALSPRSPRGSAGSSPAGSDVRRSSLWAGSGMPSSSKKTWDMAGSQCCPVCSTTSSIPASRSATERGADLMNWGRFPTTERTFVTLATIRGASRAVSSAGRAGDS